MHLSREPRTLLVFPYWPDNPYQDILYRDAIAAGFRIIPVMGMRDLRSKIPENEGQVLHVHWTAPVFKGARDESEAIERIWKFDECVRHLHAHGGKLIWTVHNAISHDTSLELPERLLAGVLAHRSDLILTLNPYTAEAIASICALPSARVRNLVHPSYLGEYPNEISRAEARSYFGIADQHLVIGFMGQMRPYKGLATLLGSVEAVGKVGVSPFLLIAGRTGQEELQALEEALPRSVPTVRRHSFVPANEMQIWINAMDVLVLPYRRILNSGTVMLAATFGRPVVVPDSSWIYREYAEETWVHGYSGGSHSGDSLANAIVETADTAKLAADSAFTFAAKRSPTKVSSAFAALLDELRTSESSVS